MLEIEEAVQKENEKLTQQCSKIIENIRDNIIKTKTLFGSQDNNGGIEVSRECLQSKIEDLMFQIVLDVANQKPPSIVVKKPTVWRDCGVSQNRLWSGGREGGGRIAMRLDCRRQREGLAVTAHLLSRVYQLLATDSTCTRRELYYEEAGAVGSQRVVDRWMERVASLLGVPPWSLPVQTTSKGLVHGPLSITTRTASLHCNTPGGVLVPQDLFDEVKFETDARFILVVEKDAAFQKLLDEGFQNNFYPCILITGKGVPDVRTRRLVAALARSQSLPVLALADADPYGLDIVSLYRHGSLKMSEWSKELAVPELKWIGIHPSDIRELGLGSSPMTLSDTRRARALLDRPYVPQNTSLLQQIKEMIDSGRKCEIEDAAKLSPTYLTDVYIPMKISSQQFI